MGYIGGMEHANFNPGHDTRTRIADNVSAELARHRYSKRAAALALGMTPLYLYRRLNGEVEFSGSDLQAIADLLGIDPGTFFVGNEKTPPTPKSEGQVVGPAGLEPTTITVKTLWFTDNSDAPDLDAPGELIPLRVA